MDDMSIDIGRWTTIRLSFSEDSEENSKSYQQLQKLWLDCNIKSSMNCEFDIKSDATSAWNFLDHPVAAKAGQPSLLLGLSATVHLDFRVRYQLEVCISRDILNEYTIGHDFLKRLASLSPLDAVRRLEYLADQGDKLFEPMKLFEMEDAECYIPNARIPYYCAYVRKASVTPTTIRFSSPTVETSNRILRKYSQLQDRFLRVQFLEESEFGSIGRNREQNDDVWSRVERTLFEGVRIGNRTYEYLAFGNSQLRLSSAYFFCPTDHVSCADIRAWMGQLDHIKVVAKHSARLGQCFSTTREIRGIPVPQVRRIRDIERNGFCFTDGVGLVSSFFAQAIVQDMALDVLSEPTAFQFRMGGSKGVLAVWPHVQWSEVYIRDSQEKFKSKSSSLEVIRCATRSTATLNRQTIVILESLGVPQAKFLQLLKDQIVSFERAAQDASMAVDLLTKFVDENQSSLVLAELIKAGFMKVGFEEPFVLNLLKLWISWSFRLLKEKARIHVPKSAFVLGCVDETGTLRGHCKEIEGSSVKDVQRLPQIFLQFTDPDRHGRKIVVQGVCIVGRNPSLHPGDIRVVQAVDNPKLRHLSDVVVFPSKGDRPVPDMLSGGDLDGDDFFVIWDAEIIPRQWNYPPMNYKGPKPHELDRNVVVDDMRTFFVNYMKNDVLPLIAHAHLAFADQLNDGPRSQECLRLADLHSQAVDYAKTGQPAEYNWELQPRRWPHFMEKPSSYRSRKALGVLYDEVVKHAIKFHPDWQHAFDKRVLEKFALGEEVIATAKAIKIQYDISVRRLLAHHNVETEFELYSGWAMSRPNVGSDYKTQEQLGQEFSALKDRFREQCYGEIDAGDAESLDRFVAAMYKVTAEEIRTVLRVEQDMDEGHVEPSIPEGAKTRMPLISFPWIFHWVMIRLAMGKKYKPGKCVLSAARRAPAVEHGLQSLAERPKGGPSPSNTTTEAGAAVDEMQRLAAPADTVRGAMAAGTENQAVERTEEAVQADDDGEEDIYSDDRLVGVLGEGRSGMDRLAALVDEG
ncbi:hypothetical protein UVI_02032540 [Ustilaginoidea virens]|nr:hypothetical protein UVI_02032540 [Ustilaginoidea virens]